MWYVCVWVCAQECTWRQRERWIPRDNITGGCELLCVVTYWELKLGPQPLSSLSSPSINSYVPRTKNLYLLIGRQTQWSLMVPAEIKPRIFNSLLFQPVLALLTWKTLPLACDVNREQLWDLNSRTREGERQTTAKLLDPVTRRWPGCIQSTAAITF